MSWEKTTIGKHCTVTSSKRFHLSDRSNSGIPFYCSKEIIQKANGQKVIDCDYIREEAYETVKAKFGVPECGDLLITTRGTYGVPYIYKPEDKFYFADGNLTWLKDFDKNLTAEFLYYWILSYEGQKKIDAIAKGTAQKAVPIASIKDVELSIPDIDIQRRIVSVLASYDTLIQNNQKQIKLLEEAAQRLYKEWFVDLRFPGYEEVKIVDGVPEGWKKESINSKIELLSGYAFKSSEFNDKGKYKIITIKNVKDGQFDGDNVNHMINIPEKMPEHCKLADGDILLSLTGNVGRVCIVHGENYLLNQRVAKLRSNNMAYTYCLFRNKDMFDSMNNLANGAAQQNLSPIRTGKINIVFPTDALIQMFEKIVNPMINKITVLNKSMLSLSQARDRLLPKLMNGEIEV